MGYIKDGDTVGTITPDSLLLTSIKLNESNESKAFRVFPNPATDVLNIFLLQENNIDDTYYRNKKYTRCYLFFKKNLLNKEESIDVSNLKPGVYFYTIHQNKANFQRGKILIY